MPAARRAGRGRRGPVRDVSQHPQGPPETPIQTPIRSSITPIRAKNAHSDFREIPTPEDFAHDLPIQPARKPPLIIPQGRTDREASQGQRLGDERAKSPGQLSRILAGGGSPSRAPGGTAGWISLRGLSVTSTRRDGRLDQLESVVRHEHPEGRPAGGAAGRTDGRTDRRTDGQTDGRTDG